MPRIVLPKKGQAAPLTIMRFLDGGGKIGALLHEIDWSTTPLGPIGNWPQPLKVAVSIMLNSGHPMFIAWGPSLTFLFNDAYLPILGAKGAKPAEVLGKPFAELWADVWPEVKPMVDSALSGKAFWAEDFPFIIHRNGYPEQTYFTFSFSPIRDESGKVGGLFCACHETTEKVLATQQRDEAAEELRKSTEQLKLATEAAEIGLFDHNVEMDEIIWDARTKHHFGLPPDADITLVTFFSGLHPEDRERVSKVIESILVGENKDHYQVEYRTIGLRDGIERWISAKGQTFYNEQGQAYRLIGTTMDISERKHTEKLLREAAQHDILTGLPNRALLYEYCEHLFAMAERAGVESAVLFIDLDRFKPINDLYGHKVGDQVLQEVAQRLLSCVRKEDIVCRLGGDEFIIMLPRIHTAIEPETVAQHILDKIAQPFDIDGLTISISPSIGISLYDKHAKDLETLIRCADLAMYSAKKGGRNNYRIYTPGHDERANDLLRLEMYMKQVLDEQGLMLYYQPIIDIKKGHVVGAEALLRLIGEDGQLLSPEEFIPIAEAAGLIERLGSWVVGEACRQHETWIKAGLPPINISINVSALEFRQREFAANFLNVIKNSRINPGCLQIEITETMVMDNIQESVNTLDEIKAIGVQIALDDFGTGYSSLSLLQRLPIDKLKIDRSFIHRIDTDLPKQSIIEAIIGLGHNMNLKVVGEGIESQEAMDYLCDHSCDEAQGFLFSRALPPQQFENWFKNYSRQVH
jgi:diguanylate cyclase (GGDEF)-like protein/PAS domain S-box-containing protein